MTPKEALELLAFPEPVNELLNEWVDECLDYFEVGSLDQLNNMNEFVRPGDHCTVCGKRVTHPCQYVYGAVSNTEDWKPDKSNYFLCTDHMYQFRNTLKGLFGDEIEGHEIWIKMMDGEPGPVLEKVRVVREAIKTLREAGWTVEIKEHGWIIEGHRNPPNEEKNGLN